MLTQRHPPVTTPILCYKQVLLSKSFQKGPPKKTCGKCGCSHNHRECPAYLITCSSCGKKNHWAQQCRSSRGGTVQLVTHLPWEGHKTDKKIQWQAVQQGQGMGRRRQQTAVIHSQEARYRPRMRRKATQDCHPHGY